MIHYGNTQPNPLESKVWLQANGQLKTYNSHTKQWGNMTSSSTDNEQPDEGSGEITFNAWVIVSGGGLSGGVENALEHENQTFTALDGMTWKEYIDSEYGQDSPFFYYEGGGVFISDAGMWLPQEYIISLAGTHVSENDKIIANAQYDNSARNV